MVFEALRSNNWLKVADRIKRDYSDVADACTQAMSLPEHHEWIRYAANKLVIGGDTLWQVMCSEWATTCITKDDVANIVQPVEDALNRVYAHSRHLRLWRLFGEEVDPKKTKPVTPDDPNEVFVPFGRS